MNLSEGVRRRKNFWRVSLLNSQWKMTVQLTFENFFFVVGFRCGGRKQRQKTSRHVRILWVVCLTFFALQHAATRCNTLQHTATRCNALTHPAPDFVELLQLVVLQAMIDVYVTCDLYVLYRMICGECACNELCMQHMRWCVFDILCVFVVCIYYVWSVNMQWGYTCVSFHTIYTDHV